MFTLFFNLFVAMFVGRWDTFTINNVGVMVISPLNKLGEILTSMFNDTTTPITDLGTILIDETYSIQNWISIVAFILALITSIGIVVMAVKGVKKAFGIFFMGIRNI